MSYQTKKSKIIEFIRTPIGAGTTFVVLVIIVALVALSIIRLRENAYLDDGMYLEVDPASGVEILFGPVTNGDEEESKPMYIGLYDILANNGLTAEQYGLLRDTIEEYARENNIDLERVSYLKDSYESKGAFIWDFTVVLNIDHVTLKVEINSRAVWGKFIGSTVTLWNESGEEVYKVEVTEDNICNYIEDIECGDDGA